MDIDKYFSDLENDVAMHDVTASQLFTNVKGTLKPLIELLRQQAEEWKDRYYLALDDRDRV